MLLYRIEPNFEINHKSHFIDYDGSIYRLSEILLLKKQAYKTQHELLKCYVRTKFNVKAEAKVKNLTSIDSPETHLKLT